MYTLKFDTTTLNSRVFSTIVFAYIKLIRVLVVQFPSIPRQLAKLVENRVYGMMELV